MWSGKDVEPRHIRIVTDIWKLQGSFRNWNKKQKKNIDFGHVRWGNFCEEQYTEVSNSSLKTVTGSQSKMLPCWLSNFSDICSCAPTLLSVWISILPLQFLYAVMVLSTSDLHKSKWHHLATDSPSVTQYWVAHAFIKIPQSFVRKRRLHTNG